MRTFRLRNQDGKDIGEGVEWTDEMVTVHLDEGEDSKDRSYQFLSSLPYDLTIVWHDAEQRWVDRETVPYERSAGGPGVKTLPPAIFQAH